MTLGINFYTYQKKYQHYVTLILCYLFAILYGIWLQPNTVFLRNVCLIGGAILSLPIIYANWRLFLSKKAIPIWLIALLLIWVTFHLFFIGQEHSTQLMEYTKSWKKIAISSVFALGLGLSLGFPVNLEVSNTGWNRRYWQIIYGGFTLPVMLYFFKLGITHFAVLYDFRLSPFLIHSREIFTDPFAIHRSGYVFFVFPALVIAFHQIFQAINQKIIISRGNIIYLAVIILTLLLFFIENDRLGAAFGFAFLGLASISSFKSILRMRSFSSVVLILVIIIGALGTLGVSYRQNAQWQTLLADAKVAVEVDQYNAWKYSRETHPDLPLNEYGTPASLSNYERIAWATVGARLLSQHPMGYGLMSQSFGRWCRIYWPDSQTSWSHSAWLDFALGYGVLGVALIFLAALLTWVNSKNTTHRWNLIGRWVLGAWVILLFTKELSAEVYINCFIFVLIWGAALTLPKQLRNIKFIDINRS